MSDRSAPPSPAGPSPADPSDSTDGRPDGPVDGPVLPPMPSETPAASKVSRRERKAAEARDRAAAPSAPATEAGSDTAIRAGFAEELRAKLAEDGQAPATTAVVAPGATDVAKPAKPAKAKPRGPRRARLRLTRIDPWSVMKTAFLLSIAFGIVTVVSVAMIWQVLNSAGVWDSINSTIRDVIDEPSTANFDVRDYVGTDRVLGFTMLVAAVDVVLLTAIATLGAFLYNMTAALLGGIEVTLAEDH